MIIVRLENTIAKQGPYSSTGGSLVLEAHGFACDEPDVSWHPGPISSFGEEWYNNPAFECLSYQIKFGFLNLRQLNRWFPRKVQLDLHAAGFVIARYKVPKANVVLSPLQIAFDSTKAVLWKSSPISPSSPTPERPSSESVSAVF